MSQVYNLIVLKINFFIREKAPNEAQTKRDLRCLIAFNLKDELILIIHKCQILHSWIHHTIT